MSNSPKLPRGDRVYKVLMARAREINGEKSCGCRLHYPCRCMVALPPTVMRMSSEDPVMLDLNKPVQTRNGQHARIICNNVNSSKGNILALVTQSDGSERAIQCYANGRYFPTNDPCGDDLINVPEVTTNYYNVYCDKSVGPAHHSRSGKHQHAIALIGMTFEGIGDDMKLVNVEIA